MKYSIQAEDGRICGYNFPSGPYLTNNKNLIYSWEDESWAKVQLPLYEQALGIKASVVPTEEALRHPAFSGNPG